MKTRLITSLFSVAMPAAVSLVTAQPGGAGQIDASFLAGSGVLVSSFLNATAVQADGTILIGGACDVHNNDTAAPGRNMRLNGTRHGSRFGKDPSEVLPQQRRGRAAENAR